MVLQVADKLVEFEFLLPIQIDRGVSLNILQFIVSQPVRLHYIMKMKDVCGI